MTANSVALPAWDWVHKNLTAPILQNGFASVATAGGIGGLALLWSAFGACTGEVQRDVAAGEAQLFRGQVESAEHVGADAVAVSARCSCGYVLMASAEVQAMRSALADKDLVKAETARAACYAHAVRAQQLGDKSPRNSAALKICKASEESAPDP